MGHPDRIIPLARLSEGLRLCAQNIRDLVVDAEIILSRGHGYHAVALAIFAFEELGKYSELKTLGEESRKRNESNVTVKDDLFRRHDHKQNIAKKLIPDDAMTILPAAFDARVFDPKAFQTEVVSVEPQLRLECVFVDWVEGEWQFGTPHDTEHIRKFLHAIMDALNKLVG